MDGGVNYLRKIPKSKLLIVAFHQQKQRAFDKKVNMNFQGLRERHFVPDQRLPLDRGYFTGKCNCANGLLAFLKISSNN